VAALREVDFIGWPEDKSARIAVYKYLCCRGD
jgi:hypothetical protein